MHELDQSCTHHIAHSHGSSQNVISNYERKIITENEENYYNHADDIEIIVPSKIFMSLRVRVYHCSKHV